MTMREVLGITRVPAYKEFKAFLQVMEVYGCGYLDDVDYLKYSLRQKVSHQESMTDQLDKLIHLYDIIIHSLVMGQQEKIKGEMPTYHTEFMKCLTF